MFIDSHAHLEMGEFDGDRDEVLSRALAAGVERIVTVGTNLPDCRKAVEIAHRHPSVYMPLSESIPTRPEPSTAKPTMS